ncbi:hypothetical protein NUW54_g8173 [Trametes sanguinea]|uniref:Uncharacterized protein n=1 Tax=Trametes sanguinea TaxID=158606 RepID=A0ACC1PFD0_9APHY|nr:hypothetical protein NUW54_g8173 [Trametes sanguinea]
MTTLPDADMFLSINVEEHDIGPDWSGHGLASGREMHTIYSAETASTHRPRQHDNHDSGRDPDLPRKPPQSASSANYSVGGTLGAEEARGGERGSDDLPGTVSSPPFFPLSPSLLYNPHPRTCPFHLLVPILLAASLPSLSPQPHAMQSSRISTDPDDPLAAAIAPPPNETPEERERRLRQEEEAKRISDEIDERLKLDRAAWKRHKSTFKLLLLGQSESGKHSSSTRLPTYPPPRFSIWPGPLSSTRLSSWPTCQFSAALDSSFLKECAARNTNNFSAVVDQLNPEEILVVRKAVSEQ